MTPLDLPQFGDVYGFKYLPDQEVAPQVYQQQAPVAAAPMPAIKKPDPKKPDPTPPNQATPAGAGPTAVDADGAPIPSIVTSDRNSKLNIKGVKAEDLDKAIKVLSLPKPPTSRSIAMDRMAGTMRALGKK